MQETLEGAKSAMRIHYLEGNQSIKVRKEIIDDC